MAESGMSDHRFFDVLSGRFREKLPFRFSLMKNQRELRLYTQQRPLGW